jgi:excinuclease ABC subunit C
MIHEGFSENYSQLRAFARNAPVEPGVYLWRDAENRIIYVGKALNIRNRLNSYFSGSKDVKTAALISHSKTIETIIVSNEYEALLLENTLIKQHSPRYNINLKDGKTYPVVRITSGDFPRVFRTRHIIEDGSQYFGPFPNVQILDETLAVIEKLFPLRKCRTMKKRENPCMYYHINRCLAPCCGRVEDPVYKAQVEKVRKLLAGETSALIKDLSAQMQTAAAALKFEEAVGFRNAIRAIESLSENNSVADMDPESRDYIAWAEEGIFTTFSVLSMRGGRMTGRELFNSRSAAKEDESLVTFLAAYYSPDHPPPQRIYLTGFSVDVDVLYRYFREQFGYTPDLIWQEGLEKRHIAALSMARQNAQEELKRRLRERGAGPALDELKRVLGLKARPELIEGFDIAQLEGKHPVASLISFKNGVPDRKNYRYFKLRTVIGIVDDFASIREAVQRRYSRLIREGRELPDLVLIDGGIGQVNAARGVMDKLGIDCDVIGLAKKEEEIWLPKAVTPILLSRKSEALKVLQHVRDETHRFATGLNQRLRSGDLYFPVLESIEGIGPKRAAAIMKAFGNLEKIAAAGAEEIALKCGIPSTAAKAAKSAARLALEDQKTKKLSLSLELSADSAANLAEEAFAAEETPDYKP